MKLKNKIKAKAFEFVQMCMYSRYIIKYNMKIFASRTEIKWMRKATNKR